MCDTCGCERAPRTVAVGLGEKLAAAGAPAAAHNRAHFAACRMRAINVMGSPGSGKTALLEATARAVGKRHRIAALSGDLATDRDARRLRAAGIPSVPIATGQACHLDAEMVHRALHDLPPDACDWLFVENVGNLVCPAFFDLGQEADVVVLSVTEGEDKPLKYPVMFRQAGVVVLTKIDLLPYLGGVSVEAIEDALARVMPEPRLIPVSARTGEGLERWVEWLERENPLDAK